MGRKAEEMLHYHAVTPPPAASHRVRLAHQIRRPHGFPGPEDFELVTAQLPLLRDGTALVENLYLSVDPYMRQLMDEGGWELGEPLEGRSIGRVMESRDERLPVGAIVLHREGWRTHAAISGSDPRIRLLPDDRLPLQTHLDVLGGTGLTAYVGLARIARLQPGETVFISAAAGGVGTTAGQVARLFGAKRVIGSAGSEAKARHLVERLGFDAAFNYKDGPVGDQLREAAPDGIDVYFDNVGGDHLEAAIDVMVDHGRIAWCGAIAQYHDHEPPAAPRNLFEVQDKRLRMEGFAVFEHADAYDEWHAFATPHVESGRLLSEHTVVQGFDHVVDAFLGMLRGDNLGKMIVSLE